MSLKLSNSGRRFAGISASLATLSLLLSGCSGTSNPVSAGAASDNETHVASVLDLADFKLEGLSSQEIVEKLESQALADRPKNLIASVRPTELVLSDSAGSQSTLDLPQNKFYLSVAPYETQSHDCTFHSLTTCQGELRNEAVTVSFTTDDGKEVLEDEKLTTNDNGFVGLWLPRNVSGELNIKTDGKSVTSKISTSETDPTCVTTMQLS